MKKFIIFSLVWFSFISVQAQLRCEFLFSVASEVTDSALNQYIDELAGMALRIQLKEFANRDQQSQAADQFRSKLIELNKVNPAYPEKLKKRIRDLTADYFSKASQAAVKNTKEKEERNKVVEESSKILEEDGIVRIKYKIDDIQRQVKTKIVASKKYFVIRKNNVRNPVVYDLASGEELYSLKQNGFSEFSPDEKYVVVNDNYMAESPIYILDAATGQEIYKRNFKHLKNALQNSFVKKINFSADSKYLFLTSLEAIRILELATGREVRTVELSSAYTDGSIIIHSTNEPLKTVIQDALTGKILNTIRFKVSVGSQIKEQKITADGKYLITNMDNINYYITDLTLNKTRKILYKSTGMYKFDLSSDSNYIYIQHTSASTGRQVVAVIDIQSTKTSHLYSDADDLQLSADGTYVTVLDKMFAYSKGILTLFKPKTGEQMIAIDEYDSISSGYTLSSDGHFLIYSTTDDILVVIDLKVELKKRGIL